MAGSQTPHKLACNYFPLAAMLPFLAKQNNRLLRSSASLRP
jgi:hypothetical protein